jgi:hypothetical protein
LTPSRISRIKEADVDLVFSILRFLLLIPLAFLALGVAVFVVNMGQGLLVFGSLAMLALPRWVRWLSVLPALALGAVVLLFTFNLVFWIGDWFGETFVGKAWTWVTTFAQAVVVPTALVNIASLVAPSGRRWVAIGVMLAIWVWLFGTLLNPDTGQYRGAESGAWFYGWLALAALAAAYQSLKVWAFEPVLLAMERERRNNGSQGE